jgi:predicted alternative tryptophan synthase beta-subunit
MSEITKVLLEESEIPRQWYNIQADMPHLPPPYLNPLTKKPVTPDDLLPIFPMDLIRQELSLERWIPIPEEVLDIYRLWRPSPRKEAKEQKTILFGLSGHGHFDLGAYDMYLAGKIEDYDYPAEKVAESLKKLPEVCVD